MKCWSFKRNHCECLIQSADINRGFNLRFANEMKSLTFKFTLKWISLKLRQSLARSPISTICLPALHRPQIFVNYKKARKLLDRFILYNYTRYKARKILQYHVPSQERWLLSKKNEKIWNWKIKGWRTTQFLWRKSILMIKSTGKRKYWRKLREPVRLKFDMKKIFAR